MRISDRAKVPNGWYNYTQQPAGSLTKPVLLTAHTVGLLVLRVRELRLANRIELGANLAHEVEQDFCERRKELCEDGDGHPLVHNSILDAVLAAVAIPAANGLAVLSKALGVQCAKCQLRHEIIKRVKELGFVETVRRIKATI